jgi:hypothetical protein
MGFRSAERKVWEKEEDCKRDIARYSPLSALSPLGPAANKHHERLTNPGLWAIINE